MDPKNKQGDETKFEWLKEVAPTPDLYSNYVHTSWTLFDVRLELGHLVPLGKEKSEGFAVEKVGALTIAWPHAKYLRDTLAALVKSYEEQNGEIKPIKLPPVPPSPPTQ